MQKGPFQYALEAAGLANRPGDDITVLFRSDLTGLSWAEVVEHCVAHCKAIGAEGLVIDTIAKLARLKQENDAGEWMAAMEPLQNAAAGGLGVWINRHSKKGFSEVGESGRGNSAASGDVDIILDLHRPPGGNSPKNRRVIESLSRYAETPDKVVIELRDDEGYVLLGNEEDVSMADGQRYVLAALRTANGPKSKDELVADSAADGSNVSEPTMRRALAVLERGGSVVRTGAGKKGDPFKFLLSVTAGATPSTRPHLELPRSCARCHLSLSEGELQIDSGQYVHSGRCPEVAIA